MSRAAAAVQARGGAREGAGRKPIAEGVESIVIQIRATPEQRAKFQALGGADWFRRAVTRAKLPTTATTEGE